MERTLGERDIGASHRVSVDEAREAVKGLLEEGLFRWLDPDRSPDEFPTDEPLPLEETGLLPVVAITGDEADALLAHFGVTGVHEEGQRVVRLSERSEVVCPLHERELLPDVCRSCSFLAG